MQRATRRPSTSREARHGLERVRADDARADEALRPPARADRTGHERPARPGLRVPRAERFGEDDDAPPAGRLAHTGRRPDDAARRAVHLARPEAPVPGRLADRDAGVLPVP